MASYTISTATTVAGHALPIDTGDTVTVTQFGSLSGTGATGVGIYSTNLGGASGGFDTLDISGSVSGDLYGFDDVGAAGHDTITVNAGGSMHGGGTGGTHGAAIHIDAGHNTITNDGLITNGLTGYAIHITGDGNTITNNGLISSTNGVGYSAIDISGKSNTVTNNGKIFSADDSGIDLGGTGGHNVVTNGGTITSYETGIWADGGSNTVTNSGTILSTSDAGIVLEGANNSITNSGTITGTWAGVSVTMAGATINNSGTIASTNTTVDYGVGMFGAGGVLTNSGKITGFHGVEASGTSNSITNSGSIKGISTGIYDHSATGAHIKVLQGGSVTGTSGNSYGIYAYGDNTSGGGDVSDVLVKVDGSVKAATYGVYTSYDGNTIKVGAQGSVVATGDAAVYNDSGDGTRAFNAGLIDGKDYGVYLSGASNHIHNTGTIIGSSDAGIYSKSGSSALTNKGTIASNYIGADMTGAHNSITNLAGGVIKATIVSSLGYEAVYMGSGSDVVSNSGKIFVALNGFTAAAAIYGTGGANAVVNNAGGLITDYHNADLDNYAILLTAGSNSVTNDGKIVGTVQIGATGANTYDGSGGRLKGTVFGGTGDDTITLGHGHDGVHGGGGADFITAGAGADNFSYGTLSDSDVNAFDTVDGFVAGTDTFTFDQGTNPLSSLQSVSSALSGGSLDAALHTAALGHLDAYGALVITVTSGVYAGDVFLIVDNNGDAQFDQGGPGEDYLVGLSHLSGTLSASDIITT